MPTFDSAFQFGWDVAQIAKQRLLDDVGNLGINEIAFIVLERLGTETYELKGLVHNLEFLLELGSEIGINKYLILEMVWNIQLSLGDLE